MSPAGDMHLGPNFHNIYFAGTSTYKATFLWVFLRCYRISISVMLSVEFFLTRGLICDWTATSAPREICHHLSLELLAVAWQQVNHILSIC